MLSVPWFLGWSLRPYIQISGNSNSNTAPASPDSSGSPAASKTQAGKVVSPTLSSSSTAKPVSSIPTSKQPPTSSATGQTNSSKPYPVVTQPVTSKPEDSKTRPQHVQQVSVTKTTASKTAAATPNPPPSTTQTPVNTNTTTPITPKQAQPTQAVAPPSPQQQQQQQQKQQQQQQQQQQPGEGPARLVSSSSITLKMSADWAQKQLEQFKFSFDEADKDKSGSLSFDEVFGILTKNGFKGSKDEAKQLFSHLDVNKDNSLSRNEFAAALNKLPRITIKEFVLRKAFKQLDKDGNGTLTRAEIEGATEKGAGLDIAAEKVTDLLKFLEKESKDDVIDYEEFLRVFGVHATATVMHQVFSRLDTDHSGFLTKAEIMAALDAESELKLRAAKISDLLLAWHKDADQKINYSEFVQVWIKYK